MRRPTRTPEQMRPAWECPRRRRKQTAAAATGGCDVGKSGTGTSAATAASFLVYSDAANKGELLPQIDAIAMRAKPKKVDVRV